jgi:hypothetical protein
LPKRHELLESAALTLFVFGSLAWVQVIVIQVSHPEWLSDPLSHIDFPPFNWRVDNVGVIAFAAAVLAFF